MAAVPSIGRATLVEQPVAPEALAAHALYERHAARIQAYCLHQLGSREEAEDAVQTTFMNAFRALGRGVVPDAEAAWLFKIAENVCLSRRRSSWRRNRIESPVDFELIEDLVPGPSRQRDELIGIEDALAAMPGQQRRAILLREWQGLSYREISAELELSQSAVETLIFRARRSLARGLTEPASVKPAPATRKGLRRTLHLADLTSLLAAAKSLLSGAAALKATTAAVVVTAAAGTAVTVGPSLVEPPPKPALPVPALPLVAERPVPAAPERSAPAAVAPVSVERTPPPSRPAKPAPAANEGKARAERKAKRARPAATAPLERKAERAEQRAERRADRTERKAVNAEQRAEKKAVANVERSERRAQRKAAVKVERSELRAERGTARVERQAEWRPERVQRQAERSAAKEKPAPAAVAAAPASAKPASGRAEADAEKGAGKPDRERP